MERGKRLRQTREAITLCHPPFLESCSCSLHIWAPDPLAAKCLSLSSHASERAFPLHVSNGCHTSATSQKFRKFKFCFGPVIIREKRTSLGGIRIFFVTKSTSTFVDANVKRGKRLPQAVWVMPFCMGDLHIRRSRSGACCPPAVARKGCFRV